MRTFFLLLLACSMLFVGRVQAQFDDERPVDDYATPYNALYSFAYYTSKEHFDPQRLTKLFPRRTEDIATLATQLRQIFDGKGLRVQLNLAPMDSAFIDSTTRKHTYTPHPRDLPDIYLERDPTNKRWHLSRESVRAISEWHGRVYPFGSDVLVNLLPVAVGSKTVFGLALWQYFGFALIGLFAFLLSRIVSYLLRKSINRVAESRLGKDKFDAEIVHKLARSLSYILVLYSLYVLVPILQLPVSLSYYLVTSARLVNTFFICVFFLRLVDLFKANIQRLFERKDDDMFDDHVAPIVLRIIKSIVIIFTFFHALSLLDVNITALVAGLSIGGLAIALAAQETVRNLFGSAMIYADRPFKTGDYISFETIEGTVEDIGFRSTRIRTLDTSLIAVPNGKLVDMIINNLGARQRRRFRTMIEIPHHTPPALVDAFVKGLRELTMAHPHTYKEMYFIHLNQFSASSLSILFFIYFETNEYAQDVKYREEIMMGIIEMARRMGVKFAVPATSVYHETTIGDNVPDYREAEEKAQERFAEFLELYKQRHPAPTPPATTTTPATTENNSNNSSTPPNEAEKPNDSKPTDSETEKPKS